MTSRSLTSADKNCNFKFFVSTLKSAWTQGVIYFIITFLLGPVLLLIAANSYNENIYREKNIPGLVETISESYFLFYLISGCVAVMCAIFMFNYLNSRVNVNFYHSLPFSRTRMFFTNYLAGIVVFTVSFGLNYLIAISIPAFTGMGFFECFPVLSSIFGNSLLYFLLFYSMTVMIGMLTGFAPVQWLMTVIAVAIIPAIKTGTVLLQSFWSTGVWTDYYFRFRQFMYTTPVAYLFTNNKFTPATKLLFILFTLVFTVVALVIYHYRKSERSGNSFAFNHFASVVKYIVMFPSAIGCALIFGAIGDGELFWLLFGGVIGCLLAWMIMNSVINKTTRAMFRGVKGFLIFAAVMLAYICGVVYGTDYVFENFITADTTRSITLQIGGNGDLGQFEFKEKENREAIISILDKYETQFSSDEEGDPYSAILSADEYHKNYDYVTINGKEYYLNYPGTVSKRIYVVAKDIFGIEHARALSLFTIRADIHEELRTIANSNEYKTQLYEILDGINSDTRIGLFVSPNEIEDGKMIVNSNSEIFPINTYASATFDAEDRERYDFGFIEAYKRDISGAMIYGDDFYDMLCSPAIGFIQLRQYNEYGETSYIELTITEKFKSTLEWFEKSGIIESKDYSGDVAKSIGDVYVYDFETREVMTVSDTDKKAEIIALTGIGIENSGADSFFAVPNHRYSVIVNYDYINRYREEVYYAKEGSVTVESVSDDSYNKNSRVATLHILGDKVPEFVSEYFGEK